MHTLKFLIYYLSFFLFPLLVWSLYHTYQSQQLSYFFLSVFILLGTYSRFIEPQLIQIKTTNIQIKTLKQPVTIALIADPQFGVYKGTYFAKRLVKKIQTQNPDYILYAGDISYSPNLAGLAHLLAPLQTNIKTYAVLGNHDYLKTGTPSDALSQALIKELSKLNIPVIDNTGITTQDFNLIGYGSLWANNFQPPNTNNLNPTKPIINLMHNPDGNYQPNTVKADLTLAGHTHCGQIKIPWLYKFTLPTDRFYKAGLQKSPSGPLFVSCGLGESLLPLRLLNPPRIDILKLY